MRSALVAALVECSSSTLKPKARRFLQGLSSDELQFIAEYMGACILERGFVCDCSRAELARRIAAFQRGRGTPDCSSADQEHKMILLLEYLSRTGTRFSNSAFRA